jgi:hypothetical protein
MMALTRPRLMAGLLCLLLALAAVILLALGRAGPFERIEACYSLLFR